jgi:hypothetical protein
MANKIPFDVRHKRVTTITGSEGIYIDVDGDEVPQRITIDDIRPIIAENVQDEIDEIKLDYSKNFLLGGM